MNIHRTQGFDDDNEVFSPPEHLKEAVSTLDKGLGKSVHNQESSDRLYGFFSALRSTPEIALHKGYLFPIEREKEVISILTRKFPLFVNED